MINASGWLQDPDGPTAGVSRPGCDPAWLFTIARHREIDAARARERRPRTVPLAGSGAGERLTTADTADVAVERAATRAALTLVLALPSDQAEIIMLRVMAGLDTRTVARIVDRKPGTGERDRAPRAAPARRHDRPGGGVVMP